MLLPGVLSVLSNLVLEVLVCVFYKIYVVYGPVYIYFCIIVI